MTKYHDLTEAFIAQLQAGTRPWSASWRSGEGAGRFMRPLRHNGEPYHGVNVLALWVTAQARGFSARHWMTFNQAKELGASVRKGAKAANVYKMGTIEREGEAGETDLIKFVKCYCVFNVEEIEGLAPHYYPAPAEPAPEEQRIAAADDFVRRAGAIVRHGGNRAFYSPSSDHVQMPAFGDFENPEAYYATLLHELTHWSGGPGRIDRPKGKRFGDPAYALEELVAELGAAFLCADLCISDKPREDHAPYLAGWVKALQEQPSILMSAAGAAERACTYLHGLQASVPALAIAA